MISDLILFFYDNILTALLVQFAIFIFSYIIMYTIIIDFIRMSYKFLEKKDKKICFPYYT